MPPPAPNASPDEPTFVAILTPRGRGAVATIGVRGPRAWEIVGRRFTPVSGKPLAHYAVGRALFGRLRLGGEAVEECVVGLVGTQEVEVHCHGGLAVVEAASAVLASEGAVRMESDRWAALVEHDLLAAEALLALADVRTERAAAIVLDQYRGSLRRAVDRVAQLVARQDLESAALELERIIGRAELGEHLTRRWRVVIAGRPNAGKSSLMNALVGYQRSIVLAEPGTTRDVLTAATAFEGWPVELADTAGLRTSGDAIEVEGVARAHGQIREADLVLLVCDVTQAWTDAERGVLAAAQTLVIHHKCDLARPPADGRPSGLEVSSLTGAGIEELCRAIAARLVPDPPQPGEAIPLGERQVRLLADILAAVRDGQSERANSLIRSLLGR